MTAAERLRRRVSGGRAVAPAPAAPSTGRREVDTRRAWFEAPMLAASRSPSPHGPNKVLSPKLDGWRGIAVRWDGGVTLWTRSQNVIRSLPYIEQQLMVLPVGTVLDGELLARDWNQTQSLVSRDAADRTESVIFHVFDVLRVGPNSDQNVMGRPQQERLKILGLLNERAFAGMANVQLVEHWPSTPEKLAEIIAAGYEGAVVKNLSAAYRPGGRGGGWEKIKVQDTIDVPCTGTFAATPGSWIEECRGVGGLLCEYRGVELRVGTGMTKVDRQAWYKRPPVGKVVEVAFNTGATGKTGKVRHPTYIRLRPDKSVD